MVTDAGLNNQDQQHTQQRPDCHLGDTRMSHHMCQLIMASQPNAIQYPALILLGQYPTIL